MNRVVQVVSPRSRAEIERFAESIVRQYCPDRLQSPGPMGQAVVGSCRRRAPATA